MAFQIDIAAAELGEEVRRALLEQLDKAERVLSTQGASVKAVHESRKACKRCRALVRLVRSGLPRKKAKRLDRTVRDAARHLGPVRDADVMKALLHTLGHRSEVVVPDRQARGRATRKGLADARRQAERLDLSPVALGVLREGLVHSWTEARDVMEATRRDPDGEVVHEWRKVVKRLFHHVQLLGALDPDGLGPVAALLDHLQESLGDHHDRCVIAALPVTTRKVRTRLLGEASDLERQCLAMGTFLFAAEPGVFRTWLTRSG